MCIAFHSLLNRAVAAAAAATRARKEGREGGRKADWILGMKPIAKSGDGRTDATVGSTTHELS